MFWGLFSWLECTVYTWREFRMLAHVISVLYLIHLIGFICKKGCNSSNSARSQNSGGGYRSTLSHKLLVRRNVTRWGELISLVQICLLSWEELTRLILQECCCTNSLGSLAGQLVLVNTQTIAWLLQVSQSVHKGKSSTFFNSLRLVSLWIVWLGNTEVSLQLYHATRGIIRFTSVVTKLAISRSVRSFVAFLLVYVKTLA